MRVSSPARDTKSARVKARIYRWVSFPPFLSTTGHELILSCVGANATVKSTGGMTSRGKTDYDPTKKWGLTPSSLEPSSVASRTSASLGGGTTYVLSGHVVSHTNATAGKREYVHEVLGRGRSEKLKRKRDAAADEEVLQALLGRDGGKTDGAKALEKARNAIEEMKRPKAKGKDKGKEKEVEKGEEKKKAGYTVNTLRAIGFDPTAKSGLQTKLGEEDAAKRVNFFHRFISDRTYEFGMFSARGTRGASIIQEKSLPEAQTWCQNSFGSTRAYHPEPASTDIGCRLGRRARNRRRTFYSCNNKKKRCHRSGGAGKRGRAGD